MPWRAVPGPRAFHAAVGASRAWPSSVRLLPILMPRHLRGVALAVALAGCSGSTADWTAGGDAMATGDDGGTPDAMTGRPDSSTGTPMGHDASPPTPDTGAPVDSGGGPVDSSPPP